MFKDPIWYSQNMRCEMEEDDLRTGSVDISDKVGNKQL